MRFIFNHKRIVYFNASTKTKKSLKLTTQIYFKQYKYVAQIGNSR